MPCSSHRPDFIILIILDEDSKLRSSSLHRNFIKCIWVSVLVLLLNVLTLLHVRLNMFIVVTCAVQFPWNSCSWHHFVKFIERLSDFWWKQKQGIRNVDNLLIALLWPARFLVETRHVQVASSLASDSQAVADAGTRSFYVLCRGSAVRVRLVQLADWSRDDEIHHDMLFIPRFIWSSALFRSRSWPFVTSTALV
jgi:hypothetical protein